MSAIVCLALLSHMANAIATRPRSAIPAADRSGELFADVFPWLIALIGVIIGGGALIYLIRRRLSDQSGGGGAGFTLHDLRELHRAGEISAEEFERAKAQMIGRMKPPATSEENATHAAGNGPRAPEPGD